MVTRENLIEMGYRSGKWFKSALEHINDNSLSGDVLVEYLESVKPNYIRPFDVAVEYTKNIIAETEDEIGNVSRVFATMDELMKTPTVVAGCVMPDACPTGDIGQIPVGGVVVTKNAIHPSMHSADICCSVMMTNFGMVDPKKTLDIVQLITHFGRGGRNRGSEFRLTPELSDKIKQNYFLKDNMSMAISHLGTCGDGNHFNYVGVLKSTGETVLVTHFGSRGFGASLYKEGMKVAERYRKELSPDTLEVNAWIPYDTTEGEKYWEALQIVREWTKLNHSILHTKTAEGLNVTPVLNFWNEHNFIFKEDDLFYHAKGATPLDDKFVPDGHNGLRLIPLNMSEPVLIVKGNTTEQNMGFAPHGAGRNLTRTQHMKNLGDKSKQETFDDETKGFDVRFFSNNIDVSELPSAYKNAESVKKQMIEFGLGDVVDEILPYGCIMNGHGDNNFDKSKRNNR
jgi:tRNA-splicing ligase RtcB